jgi:hypothetical protein
VTALSGLLTYGPSLGTHSDYAGQQNVKVARRDLPDRAVDRGGSLAVGLRGGGYWSSTPDADGIYADPGAGLIARYRPLEFLGLEGGLTHSEGTAGLGPAADPRTETLATGSLQLFAFPWSRLSPFLSGGIAYDDRNIHLLGASDGKGKPDAALWGPQGGLGVELSIGQSLAFDLDARLNDYVNAKDVGAVPVAVTTNLGMLFHF